MIKVAIIGTGNIAPAHIEALLTFPERCQIKALCDIYPEKAQAIKAKFHLDAKVYDQAESLFKAHPELDLIHICTPPYTHAQLAIDAMKHGFNVVVEKPMATCLKECDEMLAVQKQQKVQLACIAQNRFRTPLYKMKQILDSGIAGKICCAQVDSFWWRAHCYYDLWWRGTWEKEGGGPTLNHAVHHIDMLNWLEGKLPVKIQAMFTNVMHDNAEVEDLSLANLKYADGSLAQVVSSVVHHGEEQGISLQCANAKLSFPWSVKAETGTSNGFYEPEGNQELIQQIQAQYDALPSLQYEGHTGEIDNILLSLESGQAPLITGQDGRRTVELISAIYKAACTEETISLPLAPADPFYTFNGLLNHAVRFHQKTGHIENFSTSKISLGNYSKQKES